MFWSCSRASFSLPSSDKYDALRVLSEPVNTEAEHAAEDSDWGSFGAPASDSAAAPGPAVDASGAAEDWSNFAEPTASPSDAWANFSTAFNSQLKIIDLTASKPPTAAPEPATPSPAAAPAVIGPPKTSQRRAKGKTADRTPHNSVRITADIDLPPSEEKHEFVDALSKEDFASMLTSSSASTSDYGELSSQASYEATTSSSHSSVASASPRHVPHPQPVPLQNAPMPASAPTMVLPPRAPQKAAGPDLAWRDEPPPLDCVEEDDFGDFQVGKI